MDTSSQIKIGKEAPTQPPNEDEELLRRALSLLRFEGAPYSLAKFRPLLALFKSRMPLKTILKTGRQSAKTTTVTAHSLLLAILRPRFRVLYACPLYEHAKQFSKLRLQPFIAESPVLSHLVRTGATNTWDQKILGNDSQIRITYVLRNVMRVRGESADLLNCDEFQEFDPDVLTVVESCLAGSPYELKQYTGTPTTTTNILQEAWASSSQAEWVIPCTALGCGKLNIPAIGEDLLEMIGPNGPICTKCGASIDPDHPQAHWEHRHPDRRALFSGYHVSQVILPLHYRLPHKWGILLQKQKTWSTAMFYNECLGEACDIGYKRLTQADLRNASDQPPLDYRAAIQRRDQYDMVILGVDWGGKGIATETSRTALSVLGKRRASMDFDLLWARIFDISTSTGVELQEINATYKDFDCSRLGYDKLADPAYEYLLASETSIPRDKALGIVTGLHRTTDLMKWTAPDDKIPVGYYSIDATRSLLLLFQAIKRVIIHFPQGEEFEVMANDFLAYEEQWSSLGSNVLLIHREAGRACDLASATNFAFMMLLYHYDAFTSVVSSDLSVAGLSK